MEKAVTTVPRKATQSAVLIQPPDGKANEFADQPEEIVEVAREYTPENGAVENRGAGREGLGEGCLECADTPTGARPLGGSVVQTHEEEMVIILFFLFFTYKNVMTGFQWGGFTVCTSDPTTRWES